MAEEKKKKPMHQTIEDILNDYGKHHHKAGKDFSARMKKFEEFHSKDSIHAQLFEEHAYNTVFGNSAEGYTGAYHAAYKHVASMEEKDKITEDVLKKMLESYADSLLEKAIGKAYQDMIKHAKESGMSDSDIFDFKGQLMGQRITDERGNPINLLDKEHINKLKGKKKIEVVQALRNISDKVVDSYKNYMIGESLGGLFGEDDRTAMSKYITPKFKEAGFAHEKPHIWRTSGEQASHYALLLQGATESLQKAGYKMNKKYVGQVEEKKK